MGNIFNNVNNKRACKNIHLLTVPATPVSVDTFLYTDSFVFCRHQHFTLCSVIYAFIFSCSEKRMKSRDTLPFENLHKRDQNYEKVVIKM